MILTVRAVPRGAGAGVYEPLTSRVPFWLEGAPNVFLETIKRGEDDDFSPNSNGNGTKTVILRMYEALGGHGRAKLRIDPRVPVVNAYTTNLLEDRKAEVALIRDADAQGHSSLGLTLDFRGFEVKTVKLVLGNGKGAVPEPRYVVPMGSGKGKSWLMIVTTRCRPVSRDSWVTVDEKHETYM